MVHLRGVRAALTATCVAFAVVVMGVATAAIADEQTVEFEFDETTITAPYGSQFYFGYECVCPWGDPEVTATGLPSGYKPEYDWYYNGYDGPSSGSIYPDYRRPALPVGTYTFTVTFDSTMDSTHYSGSKTVELKVVPAEVVVDLIVESDPVAEQNVVITARFDTDYTDSVGWHRDDEDNGYPEGEWKFSVFDGSGETVFEDTARSTATDPVFATSTYWVGAVPGKQYSAEVAFVESSATGRFVFEQPPATTFTGGESVRPVPEPTTSALPSGVAPADSAAFAVPLWLLVLGLTLLGGLLGWVAIVTAKIIRARAPKGE